ncbi:chaperone protein dnaK [Candidatus Vecturithrix granuli]|uniref:Chaperone protein dnaK n=1 Tax=Vecturithrix granuli TaxID=1499967 RepID=A0A0S6W6B6_VECG1|nr:chaperone protein dnaK [Candidatus Vecturithrix granuli]
MKEKIVGIDLGTTNSVVALIQDGVPKLTPVKGKHLLPSVVGISLNNELLVGAAARNQWVVAPERTIRSIKRKMGSPEPVTMAGKTYSPQEISAFILRAIKEAVEYELGTPVEKAVITVPAYFNEVQREATMEAGRIAGFTVERIINEPTAAALVYGYGAKEAQHLQIMVYDLGGGTFDVSIIELHEGIVDVVATAGDNLLGGDDFDELLANMLADEFAKEYEIDLRTDHQAWARLLRAAEDAKIELSDVQYTEVKLEYLTKGEKGRPLHLTREVRREEFEDLIEGLLDRTIDAIDKALKDAKLEAEDIDRVLFVGGSTRIPAVWNLVRERMGQDPHTEINPDEAVALGAAVQAGIIAKEDIDAILVDVTPLSLGIEVANVSITGQVTGDIFEPLIHRNTTIPVHKSKEFQTLYPGQEAIHIKVYQGEHNTASQNTLLGDFMVEGLKPNPQWHGLTKVTVNFQIDVNGILEVTVTERGTRTRVQQRLKADRQRMSPEQIAASQEKLAEWSEAEFSELEAVELDPGVMALFDRARKVLEQPNLDADLAEDISTVIEDIRQAEVTGDKEKAGELCDELIDLLMEAE